MYIVHALEAEPAKLKAGEKGKGKHSTEQKIPGKGKTQQERTKEAKEILKDVHETACKNMAIPEDQTDDWQSFCNVWQHNIIDLYDNPEDFEEPEFENPLLILPKSVQNKLASWQAKRASMCQNRLHNIASHTVMFPIFLKWWEQGPESWFDEPARNIKAHCQFLNAMFTGADVIARSSLPG